MKVILYMAISANGYITYSKDDTSWVSDFEWETYKKIVESVGIIICGRKTYNLAIKEGNLLTKEALNVVLSTDKALKSDDKRVLILINKQPKAVLAILEKMGFKKAILGGGAKLNRSFLKEGLVDEVYLDIEPVLLGSGKPLFEAIDKKFNLKLLEVKKLNDKTIQLHYQIIKFIKS